MKNKGETKLILTILTAAILFSGCAESIHTSSNMNSPIVSETNTRGLDNSPEGGCTVGPQDDIRKTAYDQLAAKDKERVAGSWEDSTDTEITLRESMGSIQDKSYIGKKVYLVNFPITNDPSNNMIVYLGMDNHKIIGYGYVD